MTQQIDPARLRSAAEHLEWVLNQYPDNADVKGLQDALTALIEDAKAGRVLNVVDGMRIPGAYNFADGRYIPYRNPNVGDAYTCFVNEMEGGLTDEDKERIARLDAMRKARMENSQP